MAATAVAAPTARTVFSVQTYNPTCSADQQLSSSPQFFYKCFGLEQIQSACRQQLTDYITSNGNDFATVTGDVTQRYYFGDGATGCGLAYKNSGGATAAGAGYTVLSTSEGECGGQAASICTQGSEAQFWIENGQDHTSVPARKRESTEFVTSGQTTYDTSIVGPQLVSSLLPDGSSQQWTYTKTTETSSSVEITTGLSEIFVATVAVSVSYSESTSNAVATTVPVNCPGSSGFVYFQPYYVTIRGDFTPDGPYGYRRSYPMTDSGGLQLGQYYVQCE